MVAVGTRTVDGGIRTVDSGTLTITGDTQTVDGSTQMSDDHHRLGSAITGTTQSCHHQAKQCPHVC
jgi:hypothetical protein